MYKFDTKVQHLKYKVLRTVAKHAWDSDFYETFLDIPEGNNLRQDADDALLRIQASARY